MSQDPHSLREWIEAVDAAYFMLTLDSCRRYGLITGGPEVNVERCESILAEGAKRHVYPQMPREAKQR
jgi:hypothetical protein